MTYDRIIILAAGVKDAYGRFPEVKDGIYLGGQTRMDAARLLCNRHPDTQFVVVGGHSETSAGASDTSDKVRDMMEYLMSASPKAKLEHNGLLRIRSNSYLDYFLTRGYGRLAPVIKQRPHALLTPGEIAMLPRDG